jgi:ArsR family transcriptional regulator
MENELHELAADLFGMLAHPQRLRILDELRRAPACVCHLQTVLDRPQAYVSQQLRVLREAEVVSAERDGLNVYYHISNPQVLRVLAQVLGAEGEATRLSNCPCPYCQAVYEGADPLERPTAA